MAVSLILLNLTLLLSFRVPFILFSKNNLQCGRVWNGLLFGNKNSICFEEIANRIQLRLFVVAFYVIDIGRNQNKLSVVKLVYFRTELTSNGQSDGTKNVEILTAATK